MNLSRTTNPRIISVTNQKGGVGKTTTTINLAAALAKAGQRVLIVDLDPQGNASTGLGIDDRPLTTFDLLTGDAEPAEVAQKTPVDGLMVIPATTDLSSADLNLLSNEKRSFVLRDALSQPSIDALRLDYILIDCPPSLNVLTVNALIASHSVIVPLQTEFFALEGLSQLLLTIREVRETANPSLRIEGVLLTMYDIRNNLCQQVEQDARENLKSLVFQTVIPRNIRLSEAPSFGISALDYDPASKGAQAYAALAQELLGEAARPKQEASA